MDLAVTPVLIETVMVGLARTVTAQIPEGEWLNTIMARRRGQRPNGRLLPLILG